MSLAEMFEMGSQLAGNIESRRRSRIAEMMNATAGTLLSKGDHQGAAATLLRGGDLQGGAQLQQMGQQQEALSAEQARAAAPVYLQSLQSLQRMTPEQRAQQAPLMAQDLQRFGIRLPPNVDLTRLTDAQLDGEIARMAQYAPQSEPVNVAAGSHLVDPRNPSQPLFSAPFKPDEPAQPEAFTLSPGQTRFDPAGQPVASAPDPTAGMPDPAREGALRNEITRALAPFEEVRRSYGKIQTGLSASSAAGDMAGIFAFMKMLDPGSTVREGEYANAEQARGVPEGVINLYNRAIDGQRLTAPQRQDFISRANDLFSVEQQNARLVLDRYGPIADQYGFSRDRITSMSLDPLQVGTQAAENLAPPSQGEVVDGYEFLGGDPADQNSWRQVR